MKRIGFDNDKYLSMQSAHIRERIEQFGDKLYLEFGGKLINIRWTLKKMKCPIREYHREGRKYRENLLKVSIFPNILL